MIVSFLPRGCRLQRPVLTAECMCACVPISSRVSLLLHAQRSASALLSTGSPAARTKSHSRHGQRHARGRASLWTGALLRPVSPTIPGACGCTSTAQLGLACRLTRLLRGDFRLLTLPPSLPSDAAAYAQGHNRARGNLATELLATTRQHRPGRYSAELFGAFAIRSSCSPAISSREVGTEQKIQILSRTEGSSI